MKKIIALFLLCFLILAPAHAEEVVEKDWLANSLSVGQKAKDFNLRDAFGRRFNLYRELKNGPVVLTFYRGGWCPICNTQLREYELNIEEFDRLGVQIVAVSPETPTAAQRTKIGNKLKFKVLSDPENLLAKKYGILWEIPKDEQEDFAEWMQGKYEKTLKDYTGQDGYQLPVPATFVILPDGSVIYAFKDVDYRNRADLYDIIDAIEQHRPH